MASLSDLPLKYYVYMKTYSYRRAEWGSPAALAQPLSRTRLALVTTAGYFLPGQSSFDPSAPGGDSSWREIPDGTDVQALPIGHRSDAFDHAGIEADRNLALPLDRIHELQAAGEVGSTNRRHFSIMGGITKPARLIHETAPEIARLLREDGVQAALLVPI